MKAGRLSEPGRPRTGRAGAPRTRRTSSTRCGSPPARSARCSRSGQATSKSMQSRLPSRSTARSRRSLARARIAKEIQGRQVTCPARIRRPRAAPTKRLVFERHRHEGSRSRCVPSSRRPALVGRPSRCDRTWAASLCAGAAAVGGVSSPRRRMATGTPRSSAASSEVRRRWMSDQTAGLRLEMRSGGPCQQLLRGTRTEPARPALWGRGTRHPRPGSGTKMRIRGLGLKIHKPA